MKSWAVRGYTFCLIFLWKKKHDFKFMSSLQCAKNNRMSGQSPLPSSRWQSIKPVFFGLLSVWFQSRLVLPTCVCCNISVFIVDDDGTAMAVRMAMNQSFTTNNNNYKFVVVLCLAIFVLHSGELNFQTHEFDFIKKIHVDCR